MKRLRKAIALIMSLCLVILYGTVNVKAEDPTYKVDFTNSVFHFENEGDVSITKAGETSNPSGVINLSLNDVIVLTGFNSETMECIVQSKTSNFWAELNVDSEGKTSLSSRNGTGGYPNEALSFVVRLKSSQPNPGSGSNPDPGSDSGLNPNNPGQEPNPGPNQDPEPFPEPEILEGLVLNVGGHSYEITPENKVVKLEGVSDLSDVNFMVDEYVDYTDGNNIVRLPLQGIGSNSGKDTEGRYLLEVQTITKTDMMWTFSLIYHAVDDTNEANKKVPGFYIRDISFVIEGFKGVKVDFEKTPDMYQDTVYSKTIDITNTTSAKPAQAAVYYDCGNIDLSKVGNGAEISKIETAKASESKAVTINNGIVKFNSGFYNKVVLKVTLADGSVGYVEIERLGISLDVVRPTTLNPRNEYRTQPFHGSQMGSDITGAAGAGKVNVVATFFYDAAKSYKDFDMVANLTFKDGHTETKVVSGYGETGNVNDPSLKAGDYIVWSGASDAEAPVSVSVTAVKHGATSATKFGGALFGGGSGITVENIITKVPN